MAKAQAKLVKEAQKIGRSRAREILKLRADAQRKRRSARTARAKAAGLSARASMALAAESPGVLVAEGDSWFDYPFFDVLKNLEDIYGYDVESVAHKGDAVEEMAYGGQLVEFARRVEKILDRGELLKAILLSGGGNDVAGDEFGMLLNHRVSAIRGLNGSVVNGVIDERIRAAYITILTIITQICIEKTGAAIPILVHGYDYPVPDGRGYLGGWWVLPGPWMEPGFRKKGFDDLDQNTEIARQLIDRFNEMIKGVAALPSFSHVKYVNLRKTLSNAANYKKWWGNELHPTKEGFKEVTKKFVIELTKLSGTSPPAPPP